MLLKLKPSLQDEGKQFDPSVKQPHLGLAVKDQCCHCYGSGSIPGPATSIHHTHRDEGRKEIKSINKFRYVIKRLISVF